MSSDPSGRAGKCITCVFCFCICTCGPSCRTSPTEKSASDVGRKMNLAEKYLADYGSISVSAPLLTKLGEDFAFDLRQGGTNYYNDAKTQVQGGAASFQQVVQSFSGSAQVQMDPTVAMAYAAQLQTYFAGLQRYNTKQNLQDQAALQQLHANLAAANTNTDATARSDASAQALQAYAQQYVAPSNAPSFPTSSQVDTNLPAAPPLPGRPNVTNVLSGQQFLPFQGLLNGLNLQPTISDRAAILTAAGDVATESIFRHFMGNTNLNSENAEDNVFFGFSTVSVDPGWRTSKGWVAEAVMNAEVVYQPARWVVLERFASNNPMGLKTNVLARLFKDMGFKSQAEFYFSNLVASSSNRIAAATADGIEGLKAHRKSFSPDRAAQEEARKLGLDERETEYVKSLYTNLFQNAQPLLETSPVDRSVMETVAIFHATNVTERGSPPERFSAAVKDLTRPLQNATDVGSVKLEDMVPQVAHANDLPPSETAKLHRLAELVDRELLEYAKQAPKTAADTTNAFVQAESTITNEALHPAGEWTSQSRNLIAELSEGNDFRPSLSEKLAGFSEKVFQAASASWWKSAKVQKAEVEFNRTNKLYESGTNRFYTAVRDIADSLATTLPNPTSREAVEGAAYSIRYDLRPTEAQLANDFAAQAGQILSDHSAEFAAAEKEITNIVTNSGNDLSPGAVQMVAKRHDLPPQQTEALASLADKAEKAAAKSRKNNDDLSSNLVTSGRNFVGTNPPPVPSGHTPVDTNDFPANQWIRSNTNEDFPVAATIISPLIDSEVLDLSSSSRYQNEFALAMSFALRYAGLAGQASAFEQFVKNQQFDVRTRTAQVAVNAFSGVDGKFGFQVGPRLTALGDPSNKNGKPSQTLERQSFPALIILRLGDGDLGPKLTWEADTNNAGRTLFSVGDIADVLAFADRLNGKDDEVSAFLWDQLEGVTTNLLANIWSPSANLKRIESRLVSNLNTLIKCQRLDETKEFEGVARGPETRLMIGQKDQKKQKGTNWAEMEQRRLNRLLLEDAYPKELKGDRLRLLEPCLHFSQIRRWAPLKHSFSQDIPFKVLNPINWSHWSLLTERKRLQAVAKLAEARQELANSASTNLSLLPVSVTNAIFKRIANLESQMAGGDGKILLSASLIVPDKPKTNAITSVTYVVPNDIVIDKATTELNLAFFGTGLEQVQTNVLTVVTNILPQDSVSFDVTNSVLRRVGQALWLKGALFVREGYTNEFALMFQFHTTNKADVLTWPVRVKVARIPPERMPLVSFTGTNMFSAAGTNPASSQAFNYIIALSTNATDSQAVMAREIIKAELEKHKPSSNQSSNNVLSILINENKQTPVGMSNTITIPLNVPAGK